MFLGLLDLMKRCRLLRVVQGFEGYCLEKICSVCLGLLVGKSC